MRLSTALLLVGLSLSLIQALQQPAHAQVNEQYRGLFLVGEFGEVCTMCEIIVLCEASAEIPAHETVPSTGTFTLYHLKSRTFWSQITTIWEWFIANFDTRSNAQGHSRPVHAYEVAGENWSGPTVLEAYLALEPPLLSFGDKRIDRAKQIWLDSGLERLGYCQRLPLWDSLEVIAAHTGTLP